MRQRIRGVLHGLPCCILPGTIFACLGVKVAEELQQCAQSSIVASQCAVCYPAMPCVTMHASMAGMLVSTHQHTILARNSPYASPAGPTCSLWRCCSLLHLVNTFHDNTFERDLNSDPDPAAQCCPQEAQVGSVPTFGRALLLQQYERSTDERRTALDHSVGLALPG